MAEGGQDTRDCTYENILGIKHTNFNKSKEMDEILDNLGLSDESVAKRRHHIQLLNIIYSIPINMNSNSTLYLSGSSAEGVVSLSDDTSDIDVMMIYPYNVINSANDVTLPHHFPLHNGVYMLDDSISHPLFKRLRHVMGGDNRKLYKHQNGYSYLSHAELKGDFYLALLEQEGNPLFTVPDSIDFCGPSINIISQNKLTGSISDTDMVVTVSCPFWPREINEWFSRGRRYQWPSHSDIQTIEKNGCLLVGKGFDNSAEYCIEWRMSFSMAETMLIKSFNNIQLKCYYLMKKLLKLVIKPRYPNKLCSYHMKTVLFWVCEETCPSFFKENALIDCFRLCINKLIFFLQQNHCHCYFRKDVNLLTNCVEATEYIEIAEYLYNLAPEGVVDLLLPYLRQNYTCNIFTHKHVHIGQQLTIQPFYFWKMFIHLNSVPDINNVLKTQNLCMFSLLNLFHTIFNLLRLDSNCIKFLSDSIVPDLTCIALAALFRRQKNNKYHYWVQKQYLSMLSGDLSVESSACVLKRATVCYKIGKINECMVLAINVIENISPCNVLYSCSDAMRLIPLGATVNTFLSTDVFKIAPNVTFSPLEVTLVPEFICNEMEVEKTCWGFSVKGWAFIDSIIYAYSLVILCQHYISDFNTRDDFLRQLRVFYFKREFDLCYPGAAQRAINYFCERFYIP